MELNIKEMYFNKKPNYFGLLDFASLTSHVSYLHSKQYLVSRTQSGLCSSLGISALERFLVGGMSFLLIKKWKFADTVGMKRKPGIPEHAEKFNLLVSVFLTTLLSSEVV